MMAEPESKPRERTSPPGPPPHASTESGVFLQAVIPDHPVEIPLGSAQSGILAGGRPGQPGAPYPPATPPTVEPPASSSGSVIYQLEPPPPPPPVPTFPEPDEPVSIFPPLPSQRRESPARRSSPTPIPPTTVPGSRSVLPKSVPGPAPRPPEPEHDYSKPLLIAYSIGTTVIILFLLIRNAIIAVIEGN